MEVRWVSGRWGVFRYPVISFGVLPCLISDSVTAFRLCLSWFCRLVVVGSRRMKGEQEASYLQRVGERLLEMGQE